MSAIPLDAKVFFIGIGGSGMSSLAHILLDKGISVTGYDKSISPAVQKIQNRGVILFQSVNGINPKLFDLVIYSTATKNVSHPVFDLFQKSGIRMMHRSELLHLIFGDKKSIAVAGSHGKTTTTTMLTQILLENGFDPSAMVGGELSFLEGRGGRNGEGEWGVYESDESDGTFLNHKAEIRIVTNIDNDHLDHYKAVDQLHKAFGKFIQNENEEGISIVCFDDVGVQNVLSQLDNKNNIITYGEFPMEDKNLLNFPCRIENSILSFVVDGQSYTLQLPLPGDHYLRNAMAAMIAANKIGISYQDSIQTLMNYQGVGRRMEFLGTLNGGKLYDDYGHHPTEIRAVIQSAKQLLKGKGKLQIVFQPHRFTRTRDLYHEFGRALEAVDEIYLLPIYPAGEDPIQGVTSDLIRENITGNSVHMLTGEILADCEILVKNIEVNDILVFLGAGNVRQWGIHLLHKNF